MACGNDIQDLCPELGANPTRKQKRKCLRKNKDKVSKKCKMMLKKRKNRRKNRK